MAAESICDGCGKRAPMNHYNGRWHKPDSWFERTPLGEITVTACCRECIPKAEENRIKNGGGGPPMTVVIPI